MGAINNDISFKLNLPHDREIHFQVDYAISAIEAVNQDQSDIAKQSVIKSIDVIRADIRDLLITYESIGDINRMEREAYFCLFHLEVA